MRKYLMPRNKTLKIGALNIILHPHSEEMYIDLFKELFSSKKIIRLRWVHGGMLGSLTSYDDEGKNALRGELYRFINVSPPWFDAIKIEAVVNEDGEAINIINDNYKSNLRSVGFVFFPSVHRMFIDTKFMQPAMARDLLLKLCADLSIREKFGEVSITVETSSEGVDEILLIPYI